MHGQSHTDCARPIRVIAVWLDGWDGDWPMWHDEKCQMDARIRPPAPGFRVPRRALDGFGRRTGERSVSGCDIRSSRRHGWQVLHLQDLPTQGTPVTLRVSLARWRRQNQRCERQTFSDRLPHVAGSCARRTRRVADLSRLFGYVAGGRPAERLMATLGLPQSDDTILRGLKRHVGACDEAAAVRVVGIDDWAWQK